MRAARVESSVRERDDLIHGLKVGGTGMLPLDAIQSSETET
jgi:hypothetical protein